MIFQYRSTLRWQWLGNKENNFDLIFQKLKICIKWQHTHPHLKKLIQPLTVDSFEILIYINLKATVNRYSNIAKPKGDSDSVTKDLFLSQYQKLKIFTKLQEHPHHNEIYQYI